MLNFNAVIFNIAALQAKFIKPYLSNIRDWKLESFLSVLKVNWTVALLIYKKGLTYSPGTNCKGVNFFFWTNFTTHYT